MKSFRALIAGFALVSLSALLVPAAQAQSTFNKRTTLTFSQPIEVPGTVLPAGTYVFQLQNSLSNRHIVEIFSGDGMHLITTCLAINDNRVKPTEKTVVTFKETSSDSPEALKTWFFPGDSYGQEFVYPKKRALQIAAVQAEPVIAMPTETPVEAMPTAPITAIAPDQTETPVEVAPPVVETAPAPPVATPAAPVEAVTTPDVLPKTASDVPLFGLLGLFALGLAITLKRTVLYRS